ncbi:uncharacterized protein PHACADRAFT_192423 [Phanerochaete carnosa HHB-10118-sp]|uniref:Uncharacterized protein n=1 Tax=Phanerochaete carnosa (strain HHB-10118-sp) TaxID=650164 RepID=K5XAR5_PHACS|nr:uncharacterized protein PHACADRAFT_192423 [Phanerochaete carnosa HHB-10118-sp]EKM60027.1 hypothetical protein PHACADRAFT_192423 [Phanerochaete carnosa HHB-10118-sp]
MSHGLMEITRHPSETREVKRTLLTLKRPTACLQQSLSSSYSLLSPLKGGAAHLLHGGISTIKPITSGFRLALSHNLVDTNQALRPALSTNAWVVDELRRLCRLWNVDEGTYAPERLVYPLDHKYSRANLNAVSSSPTLRATL